VQTFPQWAHFFSPGAPAGSLSWPHRRQWVKSGSFSAWHLGQVQFSSFSVMAITSGKVGVAAHGDFDDEAIAWSRQRVNGSSSTGMAKF
jgi:hypothetical protein